MDNAFTIPVSGNQYIVYLPVHGVLFRGNAAVVNLFYKALDGDKEAMKKFGLDPEVLVKMNQKESGFFKTKIKPDFKPTAVSLFLTSGCSMKCMYCYANAGEKNHQINKEYIDIAINEVIKNALTLNKKSITINYHGGGDIGVAWDLVEQTTVYVKRKAVAYNLNVVINAGLNGILSDHQRDWIVHNLDSATVSIDGYESIQNKLRPLKNGKPSFETVNKTLKYFDEKGFHYAIRTTVTEKTVTHLENIISFFCENYKARKIKVEPVYMHGRASRNNVKAPDASEFITHFINAEAIASAYGKELQYSGARFDVLTDIFCLAAGSSFCVTPEGYLTSCYEVLEKSNPASEIFFFGKIESGKIELFPEKLNSLSNFNVENNKKCRKCFAKFHCAGDCPVKSVLSEKDDMNGNYRCMINRELTIHQLLKSI